MTSESFIKRPFRIDIGGSPLLYRPYILGPNLGRRPVVILNPFVFGGEELKELVFQLGKEFPVYVVDLPGRGQNSLVSLKPHEVEAELLQEFARRLMLGPIQLLGISLSTPSAQYFAATRPGLVHRLALIGTTEKVRESVKFFLIDDLPKNNLREALYGLTTNWLNFPLRSQISKIGSIQKKIFDLLHLQVRDESEFSRIQQMLNQFSSFKGQSVYPRCETLVVAGELDHITTPYENFLYARNCERGVMAIVRGCDHFGPFEKNQLYVDLLTTFFKGERLQPGPDVSIFRESERAEIQQRVSKRHKMHELAYLRTEGQEFPAFMTEIGPRGFRIEGEWNSSVVESLGPKLWVPRFQIEIEIKILHCSPGEVCGVFSGKSALERMKVESIIDHLDAEDKKAS